MDIDSFEAVATTFDRFHAFFAPAFEGTAHGANQRRKRSQDYLQGLLLQAKERSNAENLSEVIEGASPRVLQRFLSEANWDDQAVIEKLAAYVQALLGDPEAVFVVDESGVVKQGQKSVGVGRQYCGSVGKVANCQMGVYLAYVSTKGQLLVDKRLYLPEAWTNDKERCEAAGVPEDTRDYHTKPELALQMLQEAKKQGVLRAGWVTGDDTYGNSTPFRDGVSVLGLSYVLEVSADMPVWPTQPRWVTPRYKGKGKKPQGGWDAQERRTVEGRADALPEEAWQQITVAEGAQGPRTYWFARERVRESREGHPCKLMWAIYRKNLDGSEPRYYLSEARGPMAQDASLERQAKVGGMRWPIETEIKAEKSQVGLDEYEVRGWKGWHRHMTLCLVAGAFLLTLQQDWGEKGACDHATADGADGARVAAASAIQPGRAMGMADRYAGAQ